MRRFALSGIALAALSLTACNNVKIESDATALADRAAIEDLLVSYYSHFGGSSNEDFGSYYTEDAVFDVNGRVAKGREAIIGLYDGMADTTAADENPSGQGVFHMLVTNIQVHVDGDTATSTNFWTGILNTDPFGPPHLQEHGREYDKYVKQDGKWLITHRVVVADSAMPESFRETYQPRLDYDINAGE